LLERRIAEAENLNENTVLMLIQFHCKIILYIKLLNLKLFTKEKRLNFATNRIKINCEEKTKVEQSFLELCDLTREH